LTGYKVRRSLTVMIAPADMVLFAVVVREGNFTRAAQRLGLTKQTVSERIGNLEGKLGVRLLERTTRRLRLTDAGAAYAERCAEIAARIDEANREVQRLQAEPVGLLRVSTPVLYGRRYLAPVLSDFMARYPQVRVEVVLADRRVNLVEEGFDLAIRVGALDDSSLMVRKLGGGCVYYVASPGFLEREGPPTFGALKRTRCLGMRPVETWELGGKQEKLEPWLVVNDLEMLCEAAVAGVGIARLPTLVCREAVRERRLEVLFEGRPAMTQDVSAVFPSRQHLSPKVRLFLEALASLAEPMLPLGEEERPRKAGGAPARSRRSS
jgi:DNA-binding transcriptional LysR family regulator